MGSKPKDLEAERLFDPGTIRNNPKATNYCESLMHFLKSVIGTGIFSLPYAFKQAGLMLAIIGTLITSVVLCNCCNIIVRCAHKFYYYSNKPTMTYAEVANYAFENGPQCARKLSKSLSVIVSVSIFITYFGTCIAYNNLAATTLRALIEYYYHEKLNLRLLCILLGVPYLLVIWIPNLKILAPLSLLANVCYIIMLTISFYYFFTDIPKDVPIKQFNIQEIPSFLASAIFALSCIGVVMPLENNMSKPKQFVGFNGVLVCGIAIATTIYISFGVFGYLRYGEDTPDIILNILPIEQIPGQIVRILIFCTLFPTYAVQMYVAYDVIWSIIKERYAEKPFLADYILRTSLVISATAIAAAVPVAAPFMFLIGAFCFSVLGIILPIIIEIVTVWEDGFGKYNWILWKDIIMLVYGLFAFVFGTASAILGIKSALDVINNE